VSAETAAGDAEIRDVVKRAALLASGSGFPAVMAWIADHAGVADRDACSSPRARAPVAVPKLSPCTQ
jgi:hypothetical protein